MTNIINITGLFIVLLGTFLLSRDIVKNKVFNIHIQDNFRQERGVNDWIYIIYSKLFLLNKDNLLNTNKKNNAVIITPDAFLLGLTLIGVGTVLQIIANL